MTIQARDGRSVPLAVGICFEAAYPLVIGDGVARGGQAIVVPSNNYHFRSSGESAQQGQLLRMRAMEYSREYGNRGGSNARCRHPASHLADVDGFGGGEDSQRRDGGDAGHCDSRHRNSYRTRNQCISARQTCVRPLNSARCES